MRQDFLGYIHVNQSNSSGTNWIYILTLCLYVVCHSAGVSIPHTNLAFRIGSKRRPISAADKVSPKPQHPPGPVGKNWSFPPISQKLVLQLPTREERWQGHGHGPSPLPAMLLLSAPSKPSTHYRAAGPCCSLTPDLKPSSLQFRQSPVLRDSEFISIWLWSASQFRQQRTRLGTFNSSRIASLKSPDSTFQRTPGQNITEVLHSNNSYC